MYEFLQPLSEHCVSPHVMIAYLDAFLANGSIAAEWAAPTILKITSLLTENVTFWSQHPDTGLVCEMKYMGEPT